MFKLSFKPFKDFIKANTIPRTRNRAYDSTVKSLEILENSLSAKVQGTNNYVVAVEFNALNVTKATCSCPYDGPGVCKHILNVMIKGDQQIRIKFEEQEYEEAPVLSELCRIEDKLILEKKLILDLDQYFIKTISVPTKSSAYSWDTMRISKGLMAPDHFSGSLYNPRGKETSFDIQQYGGNTIFTCSCSERKEKLCAHLNFVLLEIIRVRELQMSFDPNYRKSTLMQYASNYGMKDASNLDDIFNISLDQGRIYVNPKINILNLNASAVRTLRNELIPDFQFPKKPKTEQFTQFILVSDDFYSDKINFVWMKAPLTKAGAIKSPITSVDILEEMKGALDPVRMPFYLALLQGQMHENIPDLSEQLAQVRELIKNPLNLPFYFNQNDRYSNSKITSKSIKPIEIKRVDSSACIHVKQQNDYYVLTCRVILENKDFDSKRIKMVGDFCYWDDTILSVIDNTAIIRVLNFFEANKHELFIHKFQFSQFQEEFLHTLEQTISVKYEYVKKAPAKLIKQQSLDTISEYMIYLSESEDYVLITPVVAYGETEVAALSRRSIYAENPAGGLYSIERQENLEQRFIRAVREQHPFFEEQGETDFFYLHKQEFLESGWFLDAFENWRKNEFSILGFNQLRNNRMNAHKMSVQTSVNSGIDWFEIYAEIKFGDQAVGLKEIQKSVLNKSRFVKLDDGTLGVMPTEWVDKFGSYFRSGTINGDFIKTHHSNFQMIDDLFEKEVLSQEATLKLDQYREKLANFQSISSTKIPKKLKATLRDYQKEGLNWLNFLDEFGFGGCLADDMGLGKTIQIIAYLLQQQEKGNTNANLVIVPTSLIFNWQVELDKFAPHLKRIVVYGNDRNTKNENFSKYDIVLTSYGTMLSDIEYLKAFTFNCIILDESQAIKNPSSKRYKAVRLLQGRQRLVMTGTPIENNTFDLFAQLSFVMPGLFGSAQRFKDEYSTPIDKFQETKRAKELQQKIHPFVLRRTKTQVAKELPEKTEIVLHCEMGTEQKRVYEAYKREFQMYLNKQETESLNKNSLHVLQGLMKLRQICNSPALLSDDEYYGDESSKLTVLMEQITSLKDQHKILVFSQFVGMLDLVKTALEKEKIEYAYLTGKTKKREEEVDKFQNDESIRVFLISLKAGGTGLNLTKAEYVFLIDPWWNPAVENQAIDRAHRIGQENKVVAVRLITPNSIEEKIMELQSRKKELAHDLVHTDTSILKQLSKEDLLGML